MNNTLEPNGPENPSLTAPLLPEAAQEVEPTPGYWLKRLLACNPFYLLSVALLLYACYRISIEPRLFNNEQAHLIFNFGALQLYELLLAGTAVLLARRLVWYDSTLLVGVENLLLLVPFILISQAGLISRAML